MNTTTRTLTVVFAALAALTTGCATSNHERNEQRHEGQHERTGEYIDDSVVTARVKTAIFNEPNLRSAEINVETYKGVVQLTGFVSSRDAINRAVEVARRVDGVKSVKNDMHVKS